MKNPVLILNFEQESAVDQYSIVKHGTNDNTVVKGAANTDKLFGIAGDYSANEAGKRIDITVLGSAEVEYGGIISRGDFVTADSDGHAVKITDTMLESGSVNAIGMALAGGVEGDILPVFVLPQKISKYDTVTASADEINVLAGITATTAELNLNDLSAQSETLNSEGAVSPAKRYTALEVPSGTLSFTLDAPDSSMLGRLKTIELTDDTGTAAALGLTNIITGGAETSAEFDTAGDSLVLLALSSKWLLIKNNGVTLS